MSTEMTQSLKCKTKESDNTLGKFQEVEGTEVFYCVSLE